MDYLIREKTSSMNDLDSSSLLINAQNGDKEAREVLIKKFTPFILKVASGMTGRFVKVGHDDEVSIGMMAFDEAINNYCSDKGVSFLSFAETVIKRRLIDHFRREGRNSKVIPFSSIERNEDGDESPTIVADAEQAKANYVAKLDAEERQAEIIQYSQLLAQYGISFSELVEVSPKHDDARLRAMSVAWIIAGNTRYRTYLLEKKSLPLKQLEQEVKVSRKTLERQRKYIIAVVLVLIGEFNYLREYISINQKR
ncbi:MAG: RNA polymerase sigma factor SigI [Bacillota bacterium]|nr:RNA polymerase sigma factor SigI [Bacillota bacterium]